MIEQAVNYLKNLEKNYEICTAYILVNNIEFEWDIHSINQDDLKESLNKYDRGYNKDGELVFVKLGDYTKNNTIDKLSVELQIPCENEEDFVQDLRSHSIPFVFLETYFAPDCTSRDYSVYSIDF